MKKGIKKLALFSLLGALIFGFASSISPTKSLKVGAAAPQTHRRVYAYITGDWDNREGNDNRMFIHYWGGSSGTDWNSKQQMTRVLNDYWRGLFYYDVPSDVTDVLFAAFTGDVGKNSNQSVNVAISSLFPSGEFRAAEVGSWVKDEDKRTVSFKTGIGMSTSQFGVMLGHVDTCSPNHAYGFNSYPQIDALITSKSTLNRDAKVTNGPKESNAPTIGAKLDYMQSLYNEDQGIGSGLNIDNSTSSLTATIIIGAIGITTLAGYYFITKKSKVIA